MPNFDTRVDKKRHRPACGGVWGLSILVLFALALPVHSRAGVQVFDQVTVVGQAVFLKIRTSGTLFPNGGQRVQLQIAEQEPRTLLSGADGFAFHRFRPRQPGTIRIKAVSGDEQGRGMVLVLEETQPALLVEIDAALRTSPLSMEARESSRRALESLSSQYGIVYLVRWPWIDRMRQWLAQAEFPSSAVIRWKGRPTARQLQARGVDIAAAVGSAALLQELPDGVTHRHTFEPNPEGASVRDWRQILDALQPENR